MLPKSRFIVMVCGTLALVVSLAFAEGPALDTAAIDKLTNAKGKMDQAENVYRVAFPRSDLKVTCGGVTITPPMGLTCWAAFKAVGDHVVVMGDQVLLEDQVGPVMSAALDNGLEVAALHNHFAGESPRVMFMHIGGAGDASQLATAVGKVWATIRQTSGGKGNLPTAQIDPAKSTLDAKALEQIVGHRSETTGGVTKFTIGRTTSMHGHEMGNAMGVNTWAAFAGSEEQAIVDGDFAMSEDELQGVLKALRGADINVVAIHNHMTGESPRIMFLHFWGIGRGEQLAKGIRAALDVQHDVRDRPAKPDAK